MERVELADFLLIAESHTGISAETLARMPRVISLGEAALAAPFSGFGDHEVFPEFSQKAGIYCTRISNYQPLPDGNKRTGYDVMIEFIERNGQAFSHPAGGLDETAQMIEDEAAGEIAEEQFLAWVAERIS